MTREQQMFEDVKKRLNMICEYDVRKGLNEFTLFNGGVDEAGDEEDPNAAQGEDPAAGGAPGGDPMGGGMPGGDPSAMGGAPGGDPMGGAPGGDLKVEKHRHPRDLILRIRQWAETLWVAVWTQSSPATRFLTLRN